MFLDVALNVFRCGPIFFHSLWNICMYIYLYLFFCLCFSVSVRFSLCQYIIYIYIHNLKYECTLLFLILKPVYIKYFSYNLQLSIYFIKLEYNERAMLVIQGETSINLFQQQCLNT